MRSQRLALIIASVAIAGCTSASSGSISIDLTMAPLQHGSADVLVSDADTGDLLSTTPIDAATHVDVPISDGQVVTFAWQSPAAGYALESYYGLAPGDALDLTLGRWPVTPAGGQIDLYLGTGTEGYDEVIAESPDGTVVCYAIPCAVPVDLGRATEPIVAAGLRGGSLVAIYGDPAVATGFGTVTLAAPLPTHTTRVVPAVTGGAFEATAEVDVGDDRLNVGWLQHDPVVVNAQAFVFPDGFGDRQEVWTYAFDAQAGSDVFAKAIFDAPAPDGVAVDLTPAAVPHLDSIGFDGERLAWYARPTDDTDLLEWALVAADAGGQPIGSWFFAAPPDQAPPVLPALPAAYRPAEPWAGDWIELWGADFIDGYHDLIDDRRPAPAAYRLAGWYSPFPGAAARAVAGADRREPGARVRPSPPPRAPLAGPGG